MRRRAFIAGLGAATWWPPLVVRAQQPAMPLIGYLSSTSPQPSAYMVSAFRRGLSEGGFVEGQNVAIEYRWAEGHYDRLPALAADLVGRRVAVILASGSAAPALAAKAATAEIPIVFVTGSDPIATGLVGSLNRPGGNVTGMSLIFSALVPKRVELLHQLVPAATALGALVNPNYPEAAFQKRELHEAVEAIRQQIDVVDADTPSGIDAAFATFVERRTGALLVANDPFFESNREKIAELAAHHAIPAIYSGRSYVDAGGLMSYGPSLSEALRQAGIYASRLLKGARAADLPVQQPTKFELIINLKTAKALGITVPPTLLIAADEVIE